MRTYQIETDFVTPPGLQGQIVEVSYALAAEGTVIVERRVDRSDSSVTYGAYLSDDDAEFEPWNCTPSLGRRLGECTVG